MYRIAGSFFFFCVVCLIAVQPVFAQKEIPKDFGFVFQGVGSNSVLNTFEETYVHDTEVDTSQYVSTHLVLKSKEKEAILQKMLEVNFFEFPEVLEQRSRSGNISLTNESTGVYMMVRMGGSTKEVECPSLYAMYDHRQEWMELVELIQETLRANKSYRKLINKSS